MSTRARFIADQTYHVPGKGYVLLPAGTDVEFVDPSEHSPEQKRMVQRYAGERRFDVEGHTAVIPGERLAVILAPGIPGWTTVPAEALR